jgi:hypothetical protein
VPPQPAAARQEYALSFDQARSHHLTGRSPHFDEAGRMPRFIVNPLRRLARMGRD